MRLSLTGARRSSSTSSRRRSSSSSSSSSASTPRKSSSSSSASTPRKPDVPGYKLIDKLGEGAFATVWRASLSSSSSPSSSSSSCPLYDKVKYSQVAIKVFRTKKSVQTGVKEIQVMRRWYDGGGRERTTCPVVTQSQRDRAGTKKDDVEGNSKKENDDEVEMGMLDLKYHHVALRSIGRLLECREFQSGALALMYELCGRTLSSQLWTMKGEFHKGERVYVVRQGDLYHDFFINDSQLLKILIKTLLEVLLLLDDCGLLHCDIKPDNILVDYDAKQHVFRSIKLIDFGSSVNVHDVVDTAGNIATSQLPCSTTPEYLAPELLHAREGTYGQHGDLTPNDCINPDMWALGSVMLEIVAGFPLWFPYKSRVPREGKKDMWVKGGLLAVGAREPFAICRKQTHIAENVAESLKAYPGRGLSKDVTAMHFLTEMLTVDPHQRVRPADQLEHPWLEGVVVE